MMNKRFRIVVAGCGAISGAWLDYTVTRDDCEIVGLVDMNRERAEKTAAKYRLNRMIFNNVDEAIEKTGANLLFDLTFVTVHKDVTTLALSSGCDVFCEKPMAFTTDNFKSISMVFAALESAAQAVKVPVKNDWRN